MSAVEKIQTVLEPIGQKLGKQRHLSAISSGIMMVAPITLISAFINIIANPPVTADLIAQGGLWSLLAPWYNFATAYNAQIMTPYYMTIGLFGMIGAFGISYRLAESYKMDSPASCSLIAIIMFLLTAAPMSSVDGVMTMSGSLLGAEGLFGAMVVGICSVEITRFIIEHKIYLRMPSSVPPLVQESFAAVVPALANLVVWYTVSLVTQAFAGCLFPQLIVNILTPLLNTALNPVTIVLIVTFGNVLWLFGIHGTSVVYSLLMPVLMQNMAANAEAYAAGGTLTLYPSILLMWMSIGATGCTFGLTLLMCRSKAPQLKTLGRMGVIPNWCGVNEPILFGAPVVLNPVLAIPFLICPIVCGVLGYGLTAAGILSIQHNLLWTMLPLGMQNFLMTESWVNFLFEYVLTAICMVIYYPFFKAYEKQLLDEAALNGDDDDDDDDWNFDLDDDDEELAGGAE